MRCCEKRTLATESLCASLGKALTVTTSPEELLLHLLRQREKTLIEFKRYSPLDKNPPDSKDRVAEAAVALANAAMLGDEQVGYLILGVTDDKITVGVKPSPRYEKEFRDFLEARSAPFLSILKIHEARTKDLPDCYQAAPQDRLSDMVYVLEIEAGHYAPIRFYPEGKKQDGHYGRFPIRHGAKIRETTPDELKRLFYKGMLRERKDGGSLPGMDGEDDRELARRVLNRLGG